MNAHMDSKTDETKRTHRGNIAKRALLAAPFLLALTALGCGEQKEKATAELATNETVAAPAGPSASAPQVAVASTSGATTALENAGKKTDETLPPDIVAVVPEGLSLPGTVVEIAAVGSADVTSVMLTDRVGAKTPFTFDSESNLWRASYRVPLRANTEKLALAVTATTEANRWKRIWVFLQLKEEGATPAEAAPDSAQ
jgi:hypothetical protein